LDYTEKVLERHLEDSDNRLSTQLGFYNQFDTKASIVLSLTIAVLTVFLTTSPYSRIEVGISSAPIFLFFLILFAAGLMLLICGIIEEIFVIRTRTIILPDMKLERDRIYQYMTQSEYIDFLNWASSNREDAISTAIQTNDKKARKYKFGLRLVLIGCILSIIGYVYIQLKGE
jgi:Na+/melibiose symporter-like transporter